MSTCIIGQIGHCIGGNFNIHIWAWPASPSVSSRGVIEKSNSVSLERCHIFTVWALPYEYVIGFGLLLT